MRFLYTGSMAEILYSLSGLQDWRNLVDIALVALIFYLFLRLLRGTQAIQLIRGLLLVTLVVAGAHLSDF